MAIISDFFFKVIIYIFKKYIFLKSLKDAFKKKKKKKKIYIVKYYYNI